MAGEAERGSSTPVTIEDIRYSKRDRVGNSLIVLYKESDL